MEKKEGDCEILCSKPEGVRPGLEKAAFFLKTSLISAANLDKGLDKFFIKEVSEDVSMLRKVRIHPNAYQDDIGSICEDVKMKGSEADKLTKMTLEKILHAHPDKSGLLIIGSKKYKEKVEKELRGTQYI